MGKITSLLDDEGVLCTVGCLFDLGDKDWSLLKLTGVFPLESKLYVCGTCLSGSLRSHLRTEYNKINYERVQKGIQMEELVACSNNRSIFDNSWRLIARKDNP